MDEIHEDMNLDAKAGSSVEKSYRLQSLVLNPGDITTVDGKLKLYKEVEITPVCTLHYKDVMVSKELMQAHNAVIIRLDIDFDNFVVDDITFDAQVEGLQAVQAVDFTTISPIQMPSQVDKIEYVDFADGSALCLDMSLQRPVNGLGMSLEYLELAFPATIKIAAGSGYELDQNKVIVRNCEMNNGLNLSINVDNISLPEPVDGAVSIAEKILAKATISAAADDMKLSDLPESEADDLKIVISVTSDLKFEDCSFVLGKAGFPVDVVVGEINQALPSSVAGASVIPVDLKGNPSLAIDVQMPDLKSILGPDTKYEIVPADNGFAVYFPDMIVFKDAVQNDGYYNYNLHALEYKTGFADVDFPIEKLQIVPQDGYAKGTVLAKGGVTLSGGNITYKQLQTVVNDPGAVVKIHASMSELIPSGMGAEMSSGRIEYALDMLDDIELPDMIDQVLNVELDDVKMFLDIDGSGIPRLGENERLNLKVKVSLPSFVLLDPEDPRVSNNILNLDISGKSQADKSGVSFEMAPVKIAGLDLSGVDFSSDNAPSLSPKYSPTN